MRKRSAITGFIVDASLVLQETVGVLSKIEQSVASISSGTYARRLASSKTSAESYRSELVIVPSLIIAERSIAMMSSGQGWRQTKSYLDHEGSNHRPLDPITKASQNPRWVVSLTYDMS